VVKTKFKDGRESNFSAVVTEKRKMSAPWPGSPPGRPDGEQNRTRRPDDPIDSQEMIS